MVKWVEVSDEVSFHLMKDMKKKDSTITVDFSFSHSGHIPAANTMAQCGVMAMASSLTVPKVHFKVG